MGRSSKRPRKETMLPKFISNIIHPPKKSHSMYALMENGPMKHGSIGRMLLKRLEKAYTTEYEDGVTGEELLQVMHKNFEHEIETAWQAFLANIDDS
ncbi:MAG: hypothetical protein ACTSX1_09080 [Candidatus Heimdallarchaeaceae archaeon]